MWPQVKFYMVLGIEFMASCMATELYPQSLHQSDFTQYASHVLPGQNAAFQAHNAETSLLMSW